MSEAENFSLDLTSDDVNQYQPSAGAGFQRVKFGDYRFKITDAEQAAKEGDNPHVMLVPTFTIIAAYDKANESEVGSSMQNRYAGSKASPKFMQQRLVNLLQAIKLTPPITRAKLIGREFDGTVVWNLGKPQMDPDTGEMKPANVFANCIAERPVGAPRPPQVDPRRDSAKAAKHLEEQYGEVIGDDATPTAAAPWSAPAAAAAAEPEAPTSTWQPESAAPADVHAYRAHYQLGTPHADLAKDGLIKIGFDPDGPVDPAKLPADLAAQWKAKKEVPAGLPPLGANGAAAPATAGKRVGQRAKTA